MYQVVEVGQEKVVVLDEKDDETTKEVAPTYLVVVNEMDWAVVEVLEEQF